MVLPAIDVDMRRDGATTDQQTRRRAWLLVGVISLSVGLVLREHGWWRGTSWLLGMYLVWSVALPCLLVLFGPRRLVVPIALVATIIPMLFALNANLTADGSDRLQIHDGGVIATQTAATLARHGHDPYEADFRAELGPLWQRLPVGNGSIDNPLADHYPYLPLSFLVMVPLDAVAGAFGARFDPRVLYGAIVIATLIALARRCQYSPWARAAAICALGGGVTRVFLAWGTNDAAGACCFVLAVLGARRRPRLAGALLAVAISFKFLFMVPAVALAAWVYGNGGVAALRRWWTTPALLAGSILPFVVMAPGAFIDDAVLFNLGLTTPRFPTSGIGLPAVLPSVFHGPVLLVTSVGLAIVAIVVAVKLTRRRPTEAMVGVASAIALAGVLVPARTFQQAYLTMLVVLASVAWLALDQTPVERG